MGSKVLALSSLLSSSTLVDFMYSLTCNDVMCTTKQTNGCHHGSQTSDTDIQYNTSVVCTCSQLGSEAWLLLPEQAAKEYGTAAVKFYVSKGIMKQVRHEWDVMLVASTLCVSE